MPSRLSASPVVTLLTVATVLLAPHGAAAQPLDVAVRAHLAPLVEAGEFSGVVLVVRGDSVLAEVAAGAADAQASIPNAPGTRFRIGSLTKPFTAAAVLRLAASGRLSLDDPACRYLPNCPDSWAAVTVRHLLSHTSGIPNYTALPDYDAWKAVPTSPEALTDRVRDLPLAFEQGSHFAYSNTNYAVLGRVIEQVTGEPYGAALQALVTGPLGLAHTAYAPAYALGDARPYRTGPNGLVPAEAVDLSVPYAAGALVSTAPDVAAFARGFFADGFLPDSLRMAAATEVQGRYGLGWVTAPFGPGRMVSHSGAVDGFASFVAYRPESGLAIVVLANVERAPAQRVALDLLRMADGAPVPPPASFRAVTLPDADLDSVVGTYRMGPSFDLTVRRNGPRLFVQATGQSEGEVFASARDAFFSRAVEARFTFERDALGRVVRLVLHQGGRSTPALRLE